MLGTCINISKNYRKHCVGLLENCCYDWFEMNTLNMAQQGVFGQVIRAQVCLHSQPKPVLESLLEEHGQVDKLGWRSTGLDTVAGCICHSRSGLVAQALDIPQCDGMKTLVAMDTKSAIGKALVEKKADSICNNFRQ